jgi:F-type H+-transporting ATPase subunit b
VPQLDPHSYLAQIVWLFIIFGVLFWLLRTRALPRIVGILDERHGRLNADLERATAERNEAEQLMARYEALIADAQQRAQATLAENQARLQAEAARRNAELDERLGRQIADAERRIGAAREAALREIETVAAEVAQAATGRLIGVDVSREDALAAIRRERAAAAGEQGGGA